jgi:predicted SAM-dependent methyltransferase
LQIGGGYHTKYGWLNGDLIAGDIYLNATKRFPFPNESFDLIFAEQFIEHLSFDEGFCCLQECCRVLKKGGRIRLSTPDLERLSSLYKDENPVVDIKTAMERHRKNHNRTLTTACHFLNDIFRLWGHSFIYDEETLRLQLERAGLSNFSRQKFGCSDNKALGNLERHADSEWMRDAFQLILEAEKT